MENNNGRVTLAVLGTKLDSCIEEIQKLSIALPAIVLDVDRLKQKEEGRAKHLFVIYTAIVSLILTVLKGKFLGW